MLKIREATPDDAELLYNLYNNHLIKNPPKETQNMQEWKEKISKFSANPLYHLLVGEVENSVVSSVTIVIVENLTHNQRPYALIENVVTHKNFRGKQYATALMHKAEELAKSLNCYKIMLLTGAKEAKTLYFYENCGYNSNDKTAFIKWL